jgi:PrtD family type I secretion system ABC transporter
MFTLLRRPLLHVAGMSVLINLLHLAPAIFMLQVFDRVLVSRSAETLGVLVLGVLIAFALLFALDFLRSRLQGVAGNLLAEALIPAVARISVVHGAAGRGGAGSSNALRDASAVRALCSSSGLIALFDSPWALVYVGVIWLVHPALGAAAAAASLLMLGLALLNDAVTRKGIDATVQASSGAARYLETSLQNSETAHAMGMTDNLLARWGERNSAALSLQSATAGRSVGMSALTRIARQSVQVLILGLGAYLVVRGQASPGVMIATTTLLGRALAPVEQVVGNWRMLAEGRAAWRRLLALLTESDALPECMPLPAPVGRLQVRHVVYRVAAGATPLLGGVSMQVAAGQSTAILGPSGAGKSTLARLIIGIWRPTAGAIRLDGADLSNWPRSTLGCHLGYLPQAVELFPGSVAENIARMGEVDSAKVVNAARLAHVHDLILGLPKGYDTMVETAGTLLSPGQRQRIALARALYGDPKLVVLDEPNANLDGAGELALAETLKLLRGRTTVVVVTHRTALLQHVDQAVVLEQGRIKVVGDPAQVSAALQGRSATNRAAAQTGSVSTAANVSASTSTRPLSPTASMESLT